jgi:hypothetical protein
MLTIIYLCESVAIMSTPKKETAVGGLSESESRLLKSVFENMAKQPEVDWDKVAICASLKDAKCARERFRQMRAKHGWESGDKASPTKASPAAKSGGGGAAGNTASPRGGGVLGDTRVTKRQSPRKQPTVSKPKKKAAGKVKEEVKEENEEDENEDEDKALQSSMDGQDDVENGTI